VDSTEWQLNFSLVMVLRVHVFEGHFETVFELHMFELILVFGEHAVRNLSEVVKLGRELNAIGDLQAHSELHNVALLAVSLLIPVLLKLVLEGLAAVLKQDVALLTIFETFVDTLSGVGDGFIVV